MKLQLLTVFKDQKVFYRTLAPNLDVVLQDLYKFVSAYWSEGQLLKQIKDYNVDDAIHIFFREMPGYEYEVAGLSVNIPATLPARDEQRGMDSVVLDPTELDLARFALMCVTRDQIRARLCGTTRKDFSLDHATSIRDILIEKLE